MLGISARLTTVKFTPGVASHDSRQEFNAFGNLSSSRSRRHRKVETAAGGEDEAAMALTQEV